MKDKAISVYNIYIFGNQYVVASEAYISQNIHQQLRKEDFNAMLSFMEQIGISENDAKELKESIEEEDSKIEPPEFGSKLVEWVSKTIKKILGDIYKVAIPIALALFIEAMLRYYN